MLATPCPVGACCRFARPRTTARCRLKSQTPVPVFRARTSIASSIHFSLRRATGAERDWGFRSATALSRSTEERSTFAPRPGEAPPSTWNFPPQGRPFMLKGSILVVDDEAEIREGLEMLLASEGYRVTSADSGESGLSKLEEKPFDLLLLDVSLPDRNGLDLLREIRRRDPHLAVVLITAYGSIDMARAAFKNGAQDYITKPWSNDELLIQVAQAVEGRRLREENVQLKRALKERYNFPNIIGKSENMLAVLDLVSQVAPSRSTVLITGGGGARKDLIAKAIHSASTRADKPLLPGNTRSMPLGPLAAPLLCPPTGGFSGARAAKKG